MKEIYQNYDAVQLAADEAFIRWVKEPTSGQDAAWEAWLDRHPQQRPVVDEARILVKAIRFKPDKPAVDTDRLWQRIQASKAEPAAVKPIKSRRRFLYRIAGGAAAAVALLLIFIFGIDRPREIRTAYEEHRTFTLPDQSRVQLNADTRLRYDDSGRRIELEGEAYFEVEKGSRFTVTTDLGQVEVLGTKFNVYSRAGQLQVQCTEGRVRVTTPAQPEGVILTPDMAGTLDSNGRLVTKVLNELEAEVDWLQDYYRFELEPLRVVFREVERQFGVEIEAADSIMSLRHTGFFEGARLDSALFEICVPHNLESEIIGKKVSITTAATE